MGSYKHSAFWLCVKSIELKRLAQLFFCIGKLADIAPSHKHERRRKRGANTLDNKITKTIVAIALAGLLPAKAAANVCEPTSELYNVVGVETWDTLNVRSGPSTKYEVVDELEPNETGIWVTGNFLAKTDACRAACDSNNPDNNDLLKECFSKGNIWYEVHVSQSQVGWASAKHLEVASKTKIDKKSNQILADSISNTSNLPTCTDPNWWDECQGERSSDEIVGNYPVLILRMSGEWKDNSIHGHGQTDWADGSKYVGQYENGLMSGIGTHTSVDGWTYVGQFENGSMNGKGTLTNSSGTEKYVGDFVEDMRHGKGVTNFSDGRKHDGEYANDVKEGFGVFTFREGGRYEGEFSNELPNGQGAEYDPNGNVVKQGIWKSGALVEEIEADEKSVSGAKTSKTTVAPDPTVSIEEVKTIISKCDGAITLKNICWAQDSEEMKIVLTSAGYVCGQESDLFGGRHVVCRMENGDISFIENKVIFTCETFNGCGFSLVEISQKLLDAGVVSELNPENEQISDGTSTFYIEKYCGRGTKGDQICVVQDQTLLGVPLLNVELMKGQFGTGGPNFN